MYCVVAVAGQQRGISSSEVPQGVKTTLTPGGIISLSLSADPFDPFSPPVLPSHPRLPSSRSTRETFYSHNDYNVGSDKPR